MAAALAVAHWPALPVYGISAREPSSYGLTVLLLAAAALLGCWQLEPPVTI